MRSSQFYEMLDISVSLCLCLCLCLCLVGTVGGSDVICEKGFCESHLSESRCAPAAQDCQYNNATHRGVWLRSPTICNCCEFCLPLYGDGQYCSTGGPGTGFTVGRCGDGLTCVASAEPGAHDYCTRMETACHKAQEWYDARRSRGEVWAMETRPRCDHRGDYAPFDCVPAHTPTIPRGGSCIYVRAGIKVINKQDYCDLSQEQLFDVCAVQLVIENIIVIGIYHSNQTDDSCSRLHENIRRSIAPGVPSPVGGPRCTADGGFHPVQCVNRTCYCVDTITGALQRDNIHLDDKPISELPCYDASLDLFPEYSVGSKPFNYTTPCLEDIQKKVELVLESIQAGFNVEYFTSYPDCMPDGTFGRITKKPTGEKICVDERGQQIQKYEAKPNTPEYEAMDCKCAQTSQVMASSAEKPTCCKNGNFRKIQCRRGLCRCVDSAGRQTERESTDVTTLSCYTPDWRIC